jgi:hypothetical protein
MKNMLFDVLVLLAVLSLPGCCCTQSVCMPTLCPNPFWMEDLQDGYCQMSANMRANMCCLQQRAHCNFAQMSAQWQCPCQQCSQARSQPCPCGQAQGFDGMGPAQNPAYFPASPQPQINQNQFNQNQFNQNGINQNFTVPGQSTQNYPPASITPQGPISVPAPPASTPATPNSPGDTSPVVVPKINPSASNQPPAIIPPADPSIPLERQPNLNQVGFRKADAQRAASSGWKPIAELPAALR